MHLVSGPYGCDPRESEKAGLNSNLCSKLELDGNFVKEIWVHKAALLISR